MKLLPEIESVNREWLSSEYETEIKAECFDFQFLSDDELKEIFDRESDMSPDDLLEIYHDYGDFSNENQYCDKMNRTIYGADDWSCFVKDSCLYHAACKGHEIAQKMIDGMGQHCLREGITICAQGDLLGDGEKVESYLQTHLTRFRYSKYFLMY